MSSAVAERPVRKRSRRERPSRPDPAAREAAMEAAEGESTEQVDPQPFVWTPDAYVAAAEAGVFDHVRVELIRGQIVMPPPIGPGHQRGNRRVNYRLGDHFKEADGFVIDLQNPLPLPDSVPQPDAYVLRGDIDDLDSSPEKVVLVVEVSMSTLRYDRSTKLALYAENGYREYWILNLIDRCLEVHRDPQQGDDGTWSYATRTIVPADGTVSPLAKPDAVVKVADLLPAA